MHLIRGSCLTGFDTLITAHGGDPRALLTQANIDANDAGHRDRYIPLRSAIAAVETAAVVLNIDDFGRQLATRQTIDILGPVGVAARTAATAAEAFTILDAHMNTYSAGVSARITPDPDETLCRFEYDFLLHPSPPQAQAIELALGVTLRVLHLFLGTTYRPVAVHLPHPALGTKTDYRAYFGCEPRFNAPISGFTLRPDDLRRPLRHDPLAHQVAMSYLSSAGRRERGITEPVRSMIRQLLPTGQLSAAAVARQFDIHPKTLQRRLVAEGTTFPELVDHTRRELAHRLLTGTDLPVSQVSRQLGYAEHSVFTRACKRWFNMPPIAYRAPRCQNETHSAAT
ncbi:AraC family transcriptional regulator [Mycolicibacterium wolinskyi]|uniref:AraC family transcriptional regulator n=2 Tax=Mycobacteriaceae TaxID=1762 RepID=A0A1X2FBB5_9MYCO|nr:AraC family transcriptional regulator [Mycolicibacterium wolinskyi]MCV7291275.1 AraC family transcriptional regulator [Mycolicibacterium goodii]ORX15733.1 AraC family transcriptional regulator [Mycolicibacterium wolinskyi]